MTNTEILKKLKPEDITALLAHYEIKIGSKASRQQKENAILKFAEEKEMDLSDLVSDEPEPNVGAENGADPATDSAGAKEGDAGTAPVAPEAPAPTPSAPAEEKKPFVLPSQQKPAAQPEGKGQEMVEVKFKVNTKYGGTVYKQNETATFDRNSFEYLKAQDLVERQ
ncbi:MAG: hypothetical protein ACEQSB_06855 [Undibacterium sp.]